MTSPAHTSGTVDLMPSFIRTAVPLIIGPLIARFGFDANDPTTAILISAGASWIYYVIIRLLEMKAPTVGYLLGLAKQPTYVTAPAVVTDEDGSRIVGNVTEETHFPDVDNPN